MYITYYFIIAFCEVYCFLLKIPKYDYNDYIRNLYALMPNVETSLKTKSGLTKLIVLNTLILSSFNISITFNLIKFSPLFFNFILRYDKKNLY